MSTTIDMGSAPKSGNTSRIPKDNYVFRIMEEPKFTQSQAGNNQLVFKMELVSPEVIEVDGTKVNIVGTEFTYYAGLGEDKAGRVAPKLLDLHEALKLPTKIELTDSGVPAGVTYTGQKFAACAVSEEVVQMKEDRVTPAVNPLTGLPLKRMNKNIIYILK